MEGPESLCRLVDLRAWWLCGSPERSLHKAMLAIMFLCDLIRYSPAGLKDTADNKEATPRPWQKPFPWKLTLCLSLYRVWSDPEASEHPDRSQVQRSNSWRSLCFAHKTWRDAQPHLSGRKGCWCATIALLTSLQGQTGVYGWPDLPALVQKAFHRNQNQC